MQTHFESAMTSLTTDDIERFSRQMLCHGIGAAGMSRIRQTRVVCVGVGGLGSTAALYLVAGGIGALTVVDFDEVDLSNMHRQVIHTFDRIGEPKVVSAKKACLAINPKAAVDGVQMRLSADNAERVLRGADIVVDASDNVAARYVVNDASMRLGKPLVSGSAVRWDGQLSVYGYQNAPCYRCLFPQPPPAEMVESCGNVGVMGPVPGMIGCLQALEVFKLAAQVGNPLSGRMLVFDGLRMTMKVVQLRSKRADCAACGEAALTNRAIPFAELMLRERPEYDMASCAPAGGAALPGGVCVPPQTFFQRWGAHHLPQLQESLAGAESGDLRCATHALSAENTALFEGCDGAIRDCTSPWTLCIDVRPRQQYDMVHLPQTFSLPLSDLQQWDTEGKIREQFTKFVRACMRTSTSCVGTMKQEKCEVQMEPKGSVPCMFSSTNSIESCEIFIICRRGASSVKAMHLLLKIATSRDDGLILIDSVTEGSHTDQKATPNQIKAFLRNVNGGLNAYHREVDSEFPFY